jgi:UDPglucose--hexose-1-phosphate uridylyltransferase
MTKPVALIDRKNFLVYDKKMAELRRDALSGNWVVVGYGATKNGEVGLCPFCPGNEPLTPTAIREYKDPDNNWLLRCFPATNPIFVIEVEENRRAEGLYDKMSNVGAHEIIVESRSHTKTMSMYTEQEFLLLIDMYQERMIDLRRDKRFKYVQVFKNHGELAGSYIFHPHSHVLATPMVPSRIAGEAVNCRAHYLQKERCLVCDIVNQEIRQGNRVVSMNRHFVAVCPFASRFPYETWVLPRFHEAFFENTSDQNVKHDFAAIVLDLMKRIEQLANAYTMEIHTCPTISFGDAREMDVEGADYYHWHLEILPRDFRSSKYKREDEFHVVPITPEEAAQALKTQKG